MAKRPTIIELTSSYGSQTALNTSLTNIRNQFDNTLSRDGSSPNNMEADLDMDDNYILNAGHVFTERLTLDGVRLYPTEPVYAGPTFSEDVVITNLTPGLDLTDTGAAVTGIKGRISSDADGSIRLRADADNLGGDPAYISFETDGVERAKVNATTFQIDDLTATEAAVTGNLDVTGAVSVGSLEVDGKVPALELITILTASNSANLSFTDFDPTKYSGYVFDLVRIKPASDLVTFRAFVSVDGGVNYESGSVYDYAFQSTLGGVNDLDSGTAATLMQLSRANDVGGATDEPGWSGEIKMMRPDLTTGYKAWNFEGNYYNGSTVLRTLRGSIGYNSLFAVNGIRFSFNSGNITSGQIFVYGLRNS